VAEDGHVAARVVRADRQLRFDRVLHGTHHVHARLPEEHHENGHLPERVHVCPAVAGPNDRHVLDRVLCVVRADEEVHGRHEHQKSTASSVFAHCYRFQ